MENAVSTQIARTRALPAWLAVTLAFAGAKLAIQLATAGEYGYFRDELYFIACGEHLDWGYVDHAPLVAVMARLGRALFGDSVFGLRVLPAVAGTAKVVLTGLLVREFGGRAYAAALACLCVLVAPVYLGIDHLLSMNAFEPLFWMGCMYCVVLAINRADHRYLVPAGAVAGLGLMNKHSMVFFGAALVAGVALTPHREWIRTRSFWIGGALAAAVFAPNLWWEYRHDWATLELLRNVQETGKNVELSPLGFVAQQLLMLSPLAAPVWLAGLWWLLADREGKRYRALGIAYLVALAIMILLHGKAYYLAPVYPMLLAAGGVAVERATAKVGWLRFVRVALPVLVATAGLLLAPLFVPVLSVERLLAYQRALGIELPRSEVGHVGPLPQHYGDMFGWPEMVAEVSRAYHALPLEERAAAAIYASNYGEAGAIDLLGPSHGLPPAVCPHQNYFLWGPRGATGKVMIVLQGDREELEQQFASVEAAGEVGHPYAMGEEHFTIYVCRGLKTPLPELWPSLKHWN
jgi:hypothetical protein